MAIRKIKAIFYVRNMKYSYAVLPGKGIHVFGVQRNREKCWYPFMKVNKPHQHRGLICGQPSCVQVCTKEILAYGRVACLRKKTWSHLTHLKNKSVKIFSKWSIHSANVFVSYSQGTYQVLWMTQRRNRHRLYIQYCCLLGEIHMYQ